jgi:hypothetical protein
LAARFALDTAAELWFHKVSQALRMRPEIRLLGKSMQSRHPSSKAGRPAEMAKGSGGLACLLFAVLLACAFWIGAIFASHPLIH